MKSIIILILIVSLSIILSFTFSTSPSDICETYTSADSLFNSSPFDSSIKGSPKPLPTNCGVGTCEFYVWGSWATKLVTAQNTCLGLAGPISSWGPLGQLGPLGDSTWNVNDVMKSIGNWETFKKVVMNNTGPLESSNGPLSNSGPLGESFFTTMPKINDFTKHMQGQGIWSILGPIGPLGALGGLGPVGPIGGHGFSQNEFGDYLNKDGKIMKTVKARWNSEAWVDWPLHERYTYERTQQLSENFELDSSWSTKGSTDLSWDSYNVEVEGNQYLSINVVPFYSIHQFQLRVKTEDGNVIAETSNLYFMNWIQIKLKNLKKIKLIIEVMGNAINCPMMICLKQPYYIYVVGSTQQMMRKQHIHYQGDYIKKC